MDLRLTGNTVVRHPDTQLVVTLHTGEALPEWAVEQVGDHLLDGAPEAAYTEPDPPHVPSADAGDPNVPDPAPSPEPTPATPDTVPPAPAFTEPPRAGRGSGADAWKAYAESLGIEVPEDAGRDAVVELVDDHQSK